MFSLSLPNTTKKLMVKEYKTGIKPQRDKRGRCHVRRGMPELTDGQDGPALGGWLRPQSWRSVCGGDRPSEDSLLHRAGWWSELW